MTDILPTSVKNFVDSIFGPPAAFLHLMQDMLSHAGTVTSKGISLNNYLSFFGYLPSAWQMLVQSILSSVSLLLVLFIVRSVWDAYLKAKASGKYW